MPRKRAAAVFFDHEAQTRPRDPEESGQHLKWERCPTTADDRIPTGNEDITADGLIGNSRYDFTAMLGEGGMGEVRLCLDKRVQRRVAMKMLRPEREAHPVERVRFVREAMAQAKLEHPAIVPVHDFGTDERGALYFTMRRVEGFTLDEVIGGLRNGDAAIAEKFTHHRLLLAFASVCQAVHYAHTQNVLHCDLKPANIMVGQFGEVYVLDWGVAETDGSGSSTGAGTPGYMAPEQVRLEKIDARSDVYALGSTLFELLTLTSLHGADTLDAAQRTLVPRIHRATDRAPDRDIPPELDAICAKATAFDPADRYASVKELHEDLERYLAGDRDLAMRRELSRTHAERATALAAQLSAEGDLGLRARSAALRSVGRALAFDPDNRAALRTLVELLTAAPAEMPEDAKAEMFAAERAFQRTRAIAGAIGFFTWVSLLPIFFFLGVGSPIALLVNAIAWGAAGGALVRLARKPRADGRSSLWVPILGAGAIAMTTGVFGSLALTATFATVFAMGFTLAMRREHRFVPLAAALLTVLVPWTLIGAGVLPSSMMFGNDVHAPIATHLVFIANLVCIGVAAFFGLKLREKLTEVQRRSCLNAWQLRQLLPEEARLSEAPPACE